MKKTRGLNIACLVINLAIVGLGTYAFYSFLKDVNNPISQFRYYTNITAAVTIISSFLMIFANIIAIARGRNSTPKFFFSLRFISAVMSLLTFVTVVCFLAPNMEDGWKELVYGSVFALSVHVILPVLSILMLVFLEIENEFKFRKTFVPFFATVLYALVILGFVFSYVLIKKDVKAASLFAPYYFFCWTNDLIDAFIKYGEFKVEGMTVASNIITSCAVLLISYAGSLIIWIVYKINHAIFVGVEYKAPSKKPAKKEKVGFTQAIKSSMSFTPDVVGNGKVYHISYHDRKKKTWKVKGELADRANKVFNTQKEAIEFAESLAKKNGGSIRIHSMEGFIRKNW